MKSYKYKDLFSEDVFKLFTDYNKSYAQEISNLEVDEYNLSIYIDEILKIMHISVRGTFLDSTLEKSESGGLEILVNLAESPERKRLTKARELGYFLLNHVGISSVRVIKYGAF